MSQTTNIMFFFKQAPTGHGSNINTSLLAWVLACVLAISWSPSVKAVENVSQIPSFWSGLSLFLKGDLGF